VCDPPPFFFTGEILWVGRVGLKGVG